MTTAPMRELQPLFTTTALPNFSCPFTASPVETSHDHSVHSPTSSPPARLAFPKLPIPASSSTSTDSEILSDGTTDPRRSPSLISHLFSRNPSSSCSGSSQATPLTPTATSVSGYCRPILRRPDCASTSTSASEDNGRPFLRSCGLGLSSMTTDGGEACITRKRSTLTFAVKCPTSDSCQSPQSSFSRQSNNRKVYSRSPARNLNWQVEENDDEEEEEDVEVEEEGYEYESTKPSPLFEDGSESDDEGYEEDEEGGFTSDEDLVGTFTVPSARARTPWVPSSKWALRSYTAPITSSPRRKGDAVEYQQTSDDGSILINAVPSVRPTRGRQISIATPNCIERCSRHRSPPPPQSRRPSSPPPCPPAARSPSAIGLCRRRETAQTNTSNANGNRGWRSDDAGFQHSNVLGLSASRKGSCPGPKQSILLPSTSTGVRSPPSLPPSMQRRGSAPATSILTLDSARGLNGRSEDAKAGLEGYLRRGSEA